MIPRDINGKTNPTDLNEGSVIPCAVQSVEDNGYIMECGIQGVRSAFLPKSSAPEGTGN